MSNLFRPTTHKISNIRIANALVGLSMWQSKRPEECISMRRLNLANSVHTWWRQQMKTFSALLALCTGNSPHKGQWRGALICALNKQLSKQRWSWWFETPTHSLWRHCNTYYNCHMYVEILQRSNASLGTNRRTVLALMQNIDATDCETMPFQARIIRYYSRDWHLQLALFKETLGQTGVIYIMRTYAIVPF